MLQRAAHKFIPKDLLPRWVCSNLWTCPSSISWLSLAILRRLMLPFAIFSVPFEEFFGWLCGLIFYGCCRSVEDVDRKELNEISWSSWSLNLLEFFIIWMIFTYLIYTLISFWIYWCFQSVLWGHHSGHALLGCLPVLAEAGRSGSTKLLSALGFPLSFVFSGRCAV